MPARHSDLTGEHQRLGGRRQSLEGDSPGWCPSGWDASGEGLGEHVDVESTSPWASAENDCETEGDDGEAASSTTPHRAKQHWGRLAQRWIPEPLRQARVDPGRRGALALSLVAALAATAAALGVWFNRPQSVPVAGPSTAVGIELSSLNSELEQEALSWTSSSASSGFSALTDDPSASGADAVTNTEPGEPAIIVVSVTGLVRKQGVVTLNKGARVADAIAAAGGVTAEAELTGLNLALKLVDGDSIVVGAAGRVDGGVPGVEDPATAVPSTGVRSGVSHNPSSAGVNPSSTADASGSVNLNTASQAELEQLPGVGPVMAGNIIGWREANGPFTSVDQLQEVGGIGTVRFAQLAPLVTI